jgi:flavodoxin I
VNRTNMKVSVIYESTRGRTKAMAEAICEGVTAAGKECSIIEAKDYSGLSDTCALAIGSSTRMKRTLPIVRQILSGMQPLEGLPAASFGSYGWSGEAPAEIAQELEKRGAHLVDGSSLRAKDYPTEDILEKCRELGRTLAGAC